MQKILYSLFLLFLCASAVHSQPPGKVVDVEEIKPGKFHALLFAVQDYENGVQPLKNPIKELTALKSVLETHYDFEVKLIRNPTEGNFYDEVSALKKRIDKQDNVLIAFSGHGTWEGNRGFWLMKNAQAGKRHTWLPNSEVKAELKGLECKHLLLMVDACFGGGIFKDVRSNLNTKEKLAKELYSFRSKTAMTSGNMTTVPDKSIFMQRLTAQLQVSNSAYLSASQLFHTIRADVVDRNPKGVHPIYNFLAGSDDIGGDFIFVRNSGSSAPNENRIWYEAVMTHTKQAYLDYLTQFPNGKFSTQARGLVRSFNSEPDLPETPETLTLDLGAGQSMELVLVKGGTFDMGCDDERDGDCFDREKPVHTVTLSDYYIGKYEVTQAQWRAVMGNNPSHFNNCDNCPVENVSWNDVQDFCKKLSSQSGEKVSLPTEAEWEFAARGGKKSKGYKYAGSNSIGNVAWYEGNSGSKTHPVGRKAPNELGLYDMTGNVLEWCSDWYGSDYYKSSSGRNPAGPESGSYRVLRGGSWSSGTRYCRSAARYYFDPGSSHDDIGCRLAVRP